MQRMPCLETMLPGRASRKFPVLPRWLLLASLGVALAMLPACTSTQYVMRPAERADAAVGGRPAAYYAIPQANPRGDARVASFGLRELRRAGQDATAPSLWVRLILANNDDEGPWTFNLQDCYVAIAGYEPIRPANTGAPGLAVATIPVGGQQTFDLYFLLPSGVSGLGDVPAFDLFWQIMTPEGSVAERTPFERYRLEPPPRTYYYWVGPGYAPYGWYDPFWPSFGVVRPVPFIYRHYPAVPMHRGFAPFHHR